MKRGIMLEPLVASMYEMETGRMLREVSDRFRTTETGVHLRAKIDREIMAPPPRRPLEIKVLGQTSYAKLEAEGIPVYYWLQGQHYAYIWGAESWTFVALQPERWELWHKDVPFDASQYQEALIKVEAFWHDYIVPRIRPGKEVKASSFSPPVTGDVSIVQREDPDWIAAVNRLKSSRDEADRVTTIKKQAEDYVKDLMGDNEVVHGGGVRISWRQSHRSRFVAKRFNEAHPDIDLSSFYDVTESRSFRPTFDE